MSVYTEKVFFQTSIDTDAYAPQPISPKTGSLAASFRKSGVGSRNYCNLHRYTYIILHPNRSSWTTLVVAQAVMAARAKLAQKFDAVRTGGKGTTRRRKMVKHQANSADEKQLQAHLKRLGLNNIPGRGGFRLEVVEFRWFFWGFRIFVFYFQSKGTGIVLHYHLS